MGHPYKGLFITFEGTEGAGKSTLMRILGKALTKKGLKVVMTREPGGPRLSEKLRDLLLKYSMHPMTELFLYEASRSEHVFHTVIPALKKGKIVLCDRFTDSSLAYQGQGRGLAWQTVRTLNQLAIHRVNPNLTFFLDIDPARGLRRVTTTTRFEREGLRLQQKVRSGFKRIAREEPARFVVLPVKEHSPEVLTQMVLKTMKAKLRV